jgi:flagellum-specific peptidoglycan hydrolase FlgJ
MANLSDDILNENSQEAGQGQGTDEMSDQMMDDIQNSTQNRGHKKNNKKNSPKQDTKPRSNLDHKLDNAANKMNNAADTMNNISNNINKDTGQNIANSAKDGIHNAANGAKDGIHNAANGAKDGLGKAANGAKDGLGKAANGAKNGLNKAGNGLKNAPKNALNGAKNGLGKLGNGLKNAPGNIAKGAKNAGKGIANGAKNVGKGVGNAFKGVGNGIKKAPGKVADGAKKAGKGIANGAKNVGKGIANGVKGAAKGVANGAKALAGGIKNLPKNIANGIKNALSPRRLWEKINPIAKVKRKIREFKKKIDNIRKIPQRIKRFIQNVKRTIKLAIKVAKAAAKLTKAAIKLAIKLIQLAIQLIVTFIVPILIILALVAICVLFSWLLDNDAKSDSKNYTNETNDGYNETELDDDGNMQVSSYSGSTKVIEAFYQYFAEKSLWIVYDGVVHNDEKIEHDDVLGDVYTPLQYNSQEFDEKFRDENGDVIIADAEGRESKFYISPDALFVFDKYLHNEDIRFPEQIVRHVAYDYNPSALNGSDITESNDKSCLTDYENPDNRFILKQLTDDDGYLTITSQKYKSVETSSSEVSDEFRTNYPLETYVYVPDGDEKEVGVWDYGLGSILHYEKYLVKHQKKGSISSFQVWDLTKKIADPSTGLLYYGETKEIESYKAYRDDTNKENYDATDLFADLEGDDRLRVYTNETDPDDPDLEDEDEYFIDWVVTPAGDVSNNVVYEWADTNTPFSKIETEKTTSKVKSGKEVIKTKEVPATATRSGCSGNQTVLIIKSKNYPKPARTSPEDDLADLVVTYIPYTFKCSSKTVLSCSSTDETHEHTDSCYSEDHSDCDTSYPYTYTEEYVEWEESEDYQYLNATVTGTLWDKAPYYEGEPDMENFTGKRYYQDYLTYYNTWVPFSVTGFIDYNNMMRRINASNDEDLEAIIARSKASSVSSESGSGVGSGGNSEFIEKVSAIAIEDALHTGIYPSVTIGQAILESGWGTSSLATKNYNFFGMTCKSSGSTRTYWDGSTWETSFTSGSHNWANYTSSASDAEAGLRLSILDHSRNFYATSCYGAKGVLNHISAGMSASEAQEDAKLQLQQIAEAGYCEGGWESYYNLVLSVINSNNLWQYDEEFINQGGWDGTNPYPELGSASSSITSALSSAINSIWGWLKNTMALIKEKIADLFGKDLYIDVLEENERIRWIKKPLSEDDVKYILQSMFAYTNNDLISKYMDGDYDVDDDEFWAEYYTTLFSNPIGQTWNVDSTSSETVAQNSSKKNLYYPNGVTKPLDEAVLSSTTSDYGVYFKATSGTNVYSVADGTVYLIGEDDRYGGKYIEIDNGSSKTIYGNLSSINVSEGAEVTRGQLIATTNGDLFYGVATESYTYVDPSFVIPSFADMEYTYPTTGPYTNMPVIKQSQSALIDYPFACTTIGTSGCGLCSFASVASALNDTVYSPVDIVDTLDSLAAAAGQSYTYYYEPGAGTKWSMWASLCSAYGFQIQDNDSFTNKSAQTIINELDKGRIVVVSISATSTSVYRGSGHYITIRGHEGDKFYINDSKGKSGYYDENTLYTYAQIGYIKSMRSIWK